MRTIRISHLLGIVQRRKIFLVAPFLTISLLSMIGAFVLPKKYESYTTILLQKEQTLNPLLDFDRAVMLAGGNQLASFNEIIYSRKTIQSLLDSLGRSPDQSSNEKWDDLIETTRKKVGTDLRGNDSFRITFTDSDPNSCQQAATILCNIYIQTSLKSERQQAEETVKFLEQKVEELRVQYEKQQREFLGTRQRGLATAPISEEGLQYMMGKVEENLTDKQRGLEQQDRALKLLRTIEENLDNPGVISQIAALSHEGGTILYLDTLKSASLRYNQALSRYTPRHPQVQSVRRELATLLVKSTEALEAKVEQTKAELASLGNQRSKTEREISKSINVGIVGSERRSEFARIKDNFENTKQRLDQAKIAKALADRGASKYVILDPAVVPSSPTKPKKGPIITGGIIIGLIVGIASMFVAEYYDPTIRSARDIEVFQKPVIGYLP